MNDALFLHVVTGWPILPPAIVWGGDCVISVQGVYDGVDVRASLARRPFRLAIQKPKKGSQAA